PGGGRHGAGFFYPTSRYRPKRATTRKLKSPTAQASPPSGTISRTALCRFRSWWTRVRGGSSPLARTRSQAELLCQRHQRPRPMGQTVLLVHPHLGERPPSHREHRVMAEPAGPPLFFGDLPPHRTLGGDVRPVRKREGDHAHEPGRTIRLSLEFS